MTDQTPVEPELPPYNLEAARSSRSKCRTCRRKIDKGLLRLGILLEGPYGTGYVWHHLTCAAKRRGEDVEAAYEQKAWTEGLEVPTLESLQDTAQFDHPAKLTRLQEIAADALDLEAIDAALAQPATG